MKLFVGTKGVVHFEGKVLLVRESSEYLDGSSVGEWDMPGGRIESEETVLQGLVREVQEESGLIVEPGQLLAAFDGFPVIRGEECHVVRLYYACKASSNEVLLSADHDAFEWIDPANVGDKVLMNDIAEMIEAFKNLKL